MLLPPLCLCAAPAAAARILLIGDSITRGVVSGGAGPPFGELLAEALPEHEVLNAGCGGSTTNDWVRPPPSLSCAVAGAFELLAEPQLPVDATTILLGTNDAVGFVESTTSCCPIPVPEYRSNLEAIVGKLRGRSRHVLLLTPPRSVAGDPGIGARLLAYRAEVLDLCAGFGSPVRCGPDVHELLLPGLHFDDDVHPNAAGHQRIAAALAPQLAQLVPEPASGTLLLLGTAALANRRRSRRAA